MDQPLDTLGAIERYYDTVPRADADVERIEPFTLFVRRGDGWPFYARPALGATSFTAAEVDRVRARQRALGVPEAFEWVAEVTPGLVGAARESGLHVTEHPLLVLAEAPAPASVVGARLAVVGPDPDSIGRVHAVIQAAFSGSDEPGDPKAPEAAARGIAAGETVLVAAYDETTGACLGGGTHAPRGEVSELTGIAVAPRARRRGLGAALTALLARDARHRGCRTIFLSAADDAAAGVYRSVGFATVATACIAAPPEERQ